MLFLVRAGGPDIIIGYIKNRAKVVGETPTRPFAGGGAAIFLPIAVGAATDGIQLIKIEFFVLVGFVAFDFFPSLFCVKIRAICSDFLHLFKALYVFNWNANSSFFSVLLLSHFACIVQFVEEQNRI